MCDAGSQDSGWGARGREEAGGGRVGASERAVGNNLVLIWWLVISVYPFGEMLLSL